MKGPHQANEHFAAFSCMHTPILRQNHENYSNRDLAGYRAISFREFPQLTWRELTGRIVGLSLHRPCESHMFQQTRFTRNSVE